MEIELEEAKAEIERLKCSLADKEIVIKKLGSTKDSKSPKSILREGDGLIIDELEDKYRKVKDELKWKTEQFQHLEEAHQKLREEFHQSKNEWEKEKSAMVDEISQLQERLDGADHRSSTAEELKVQLEMCKQGLEKEENKRKRLEEEVSELKSTLENSTHQGFEGKKEEEEEGEEGVNLKEILRVKEMDYKELEYKTKKLEKENQELLTSIKELQEAHIPRGVSVPTPSSWAKLKGRLKSVEKSHRECSANFEAKQAEWYSKQERISQELKRTSSNLKMKDQVIKQLNNELDGCTSTLTQLKMQNEELSLMLQLIRADGSEKGESGVAQLMEQLEKEREEKENIQEELEELREQLEEAREALDMIDSELTDQSNEKSELELELENWRSVAAHLERQVTRSQTMRRELELSLIAQAEVEEMLKLDTQEKEKRIGSLEHQLLLMDQEIKEDDDAVARPLKMDDGEQLELELLARELEEAILGHIMGEQKCTLGQEDGVEAEQSHGVEEGCGSKENAEQQQHPHLRKTSDPSIEDRSPFRELN